MKARTGEEQKQASSVQKFADEELRLRDETLRRTAPDTDTARKDFDPVLAPVRGGMTSTQGEMEARIEPPSGPNIDREVLEHRDRALQRTPPDTDQKRKKIEQITAPERGGMR
jgi:hypothetical protein